MAHGTLALDYSGDGKFNQVDESFVLRQLDLTPPGPAQDKVLKQLNLVRIVRACATNPFELKSDQEQEQIAITLFDYNGDKALNKEDLLFKQAEVQQTGSAKAKAEVELLKAMGFDETPAVIAANEHAAYWGDPHVADADRADKANTRTSNFVVLGDGIYNLLIDKDITLNAKHKKYDQWKMEVTDEIGLRIPNADLTMSAYGVPQLNGKDLKKGSAITLSDQTKISWDGKSLNVTSGDSGEYNVAFSIVTTRHKNTDGKPIKYINTDVYTKAKGIASYGVMATGILGEGFDADSTVRKGLKQDLAVYKRQSLLGEAPATTTVALAVSPAAVVEDGFANLVFTFTRTGPLTSPLTVSYTVAGTATLGNDYSGIASPDTTKQLTFPVGARQAKVIVNPTADTSNEPDETVALTLASSIDYRIGTTTAVVGRILNDDQPVITLAVSPASVTEDGSANLVYTFSRTGATTSALAVNYTVAGTATLGSDYTGIATAGSNKVIRFAAGSSTTTVSVNPTADTTFEPDETVALTLAASSSYRIGTTTAVSGTIQNDDLLSLYNASLPSRPNEQGWLSFGGGLTGSQALTANGTTLTSTALVPDMAGYSNHTAAAPTPVNAGFPRLDRATGFALDFRLKVINETHLSPNRAGFSVILLDQGSVPQGIELGFWSNSIFSQVGGSSPFLATGERADGLNTTQANTYSLRLLDQSYVLLADNRLLLSGAVQDYSQWSKDPLLPYNPYTTPNFLFLGDNTRSASASVELGSTAIGLARGGGSGADTLTGTAAADSLNGLDGPDQLSGNGGHDWLVGGAGNDVLQGGAGDDLLTGGSGLDRFLFRSGAPFIASQLGIDTITDFNPTEDRIRLARSTFGTLPAGATLAATAFAVVNSEAAAASSTARIVYNSASGSLFYNANGTASGFASTAEGGGTFAQLWGGGNGAPFPTLTSAMFEIV